MFIRFMTIAIIVDNAFGSENFDFSLLDSSLVSSDEKLAQILQSDELASNESLVSS